ncbi:MAG TPA: HIT family protein [Solirubrobacteraceae bacterium]
MSGECFICTKHGALSVVPGGAILADEHAIVTHLPLVTPTLCSPSVYLGHLFVEPRRHVPGLADLTPEEAASFGRLASAASRALRRSEGAEHVYAAVIGHGVDHLHLHLIPRYPDTPEAYWWTRVDEWPDAPRGDAAAVVALADRLRRAARAG